MPSAGLSAQFKIHVSQPRHQARKLSFRTGDVDGAGVAIMAYGGATEYLDLQLTLPDTQMSPKSGDRKSGDGFESSNHGPMAKPQEQSMGSVHGSVHSEAEAEADQTEHGVKIRELMVGDVCGCVLQTSRDEDASYIPQ